MAGGVLKRASSWLKITFSMRPRPWPPYSLGQVSTAQPASNLVACQRLAQSIAALSSRSPSRLGVVSSGFSFSRCFDRKARARVRNSASWGVSSKFMVSPVGSVRCDLASALAAPEAARLEARHQLLAPLVRRAERVCERACTAVEQMAVVLPGVPDAAVHLDHLLAGEHEGVARGDARAAGGDRQLVAAVRERPGREVAVRERDLDLGVDVGQAVLQRLERGHRATEGEAT